MKYSKKEDSIIKDGISQKKQYSEISDDVFKETGIRRSRKSLSKRYNRLLKNAKLALEVNDENKNPKPKKPIKKVGLEIKNDYVVVNHTTNTVITSLGEFGDYVCSKNMHGAIMRAYSDQYEGKGATQAEIAMRFDFAHAKAVAKYMRHHGMTKSMIGQTDIEFEDGLTVEEAVKDNIQSLKRKVHKLTERKKWTMTQQDADKWQAFRYGTLKPFENHVEEYLPQYSAPKIKISAKIPRVKTACIVGASDEHFMKLCYDAFGNIIYNRKIALREVAKHTGNLIEKQLLLGVPEMFIVTVGGDDLHIDNTAQTTTKGTPQANSTDGSYRIALGEYLDMTLAKIDTYAQVAPVTVISTPGNHNEHTAYLLGEFLQRYYELKNKTTKSYKVTVIVRYHERVYIQYGKNCFIFNHMSKMSLTKTKRDLHKLVMSEAKAQGVNVQYVKRYTMFSQHLHHELMEDLGGFVELIIFMSISEEDDWHQDSGYVGAKKGMALYNYDKLLGKTSVLYS